MFRVNAIGFNSGCQLPCDHKSIPKRHYALYRAREVLHERLNDAAKVAFKMIIHPEARTTPQIRAEIKASTGVSQVALAHHYNVSRQTIGQWQRHDNTTDKSH